MAETTQTPQSNGGSKSTIAVVITIIALIVAGFFFYQYQMAQTTNEELQNELTQAEKEAMQTQQNIDTAKEELGEAVQEGRAILGNIGSEVLKTAEEVQAIMAAQAAAIDELNTQVEGLDEVTQCQELLEVGPKNEDTWYTTEYSENFQQDICKYMRDIEDDLDDAVDSDDEEAVEALEQAEEIAQPYYDNFAEQCAAVYNLDTCEFN